MVRSKFYIKPGYQIRQENAPYVDVQPTGTVYQPHVYELAIRLARMSNCKYIIDIGAGSGEKLKGLDKEFQIIAVDFAPNIKALRKNLPNAEVIDQNLEKGLPKISDAILAEATVISSDVIEHIVNPKKYIKGLAHMSKIAPFVVLSTPDRTRARGPESFGPPANPFHVREWTIDELFTLFKKYSIHCKIGHTVSNDEENFKGTSLAIAGTHALPPLNFGEDKTLLSIVTAYNEADIIGQTIEHLVSQGSDVHVIENWSTDDTLKIVKKLARKHKGVTYEMFPAKKPRKHAYEWKNLLMRIEEVAAKSKHDWIMHNDADELRVSPWYGVSLKKAVSYIDRLGYNAVDLTVVDFRPTKDGYDGSVPPDEFFHNFEFMGLSGYFVQTKLWKNTGAPVNISNSGGHSAEFEGKRVYPLKFINKHYQLRSVKHAKRKIFKDRKARYTEAELKMGWHIHYNGYTKDDPFLWNEKTLNKYTPEWFYTEYMVELISGIGIERVAD